LADAAEFIVALYGDGAGESPCGSVLGESWSRDACHASQADRAQKKFGQIFHRTVPLVAGAELGCTAPPDGSDSSVSATQSQYGDLSFRPHFWD
jgi:hypothetical protein